MHGTPPLATLPVTFFDPQTGLSALAVQHVHAGGRTALVYHDATGSSAARTLLSGVAQALLSELGEGQTLGLIETSMPEHSAEPFIYARVALSRAASGGPVTAAPGRVLTLDAVARACGVETREIQRTEAVVSSVHRPRACAFSGFRHRGLGPRGRREVEAA